MKIILIYFCLLLGISNFINAQVVNIPDYNFRTYLLNNPNINTNGDNQIQVSEAEAFTGTIDCSSKNINSLEGIEKFINLTELICYSNSIPYLNLNENKKLKSINCYNSQVRYIEISQCTELEVLGCGANLIDFLDTSNNLKLKTLNCNFCSDLINIDLTRNTDLELLYIFDTKLNNIDLTKNTKLTSLNIGGSKLVNINFSSNLNLENLYFGNSNLSSLDISKNTKLKILEVFDNPLITNVDVSKNIDLIEFRCPRNAISQLDVSKNTLLKKFYCHENQINNLDVSNNISLTELSCFGNQISELDVNKNLLLTLFSCRDNQLNTLKLKNGNNTILSTFRATNNPQLACIEVDDVNYANSQSNWFKDNTASYNTNCSLSILEINKNEIKIFPNAVTDVLNFSEEVSGIKIMDFTGKKIINLNGSTKIIDVSNRSKVNYLIILNTISGKTNNHKFIKN